MAFCVFLLPCEILRGYNSCNLRIPFQENILLFFDYRTKRVIACLRKRFSFTFWGIKVLEKAYYGTKSGLVGHLQTLDFFSVSGGLAALLDEELPAGVFDFRMKVDGDGSLLENSLNLEPKSKLLC